MKVAERFGENLLVARRRARLSQEGLGFQADLHRTEIGQLERGARLARVDTLLKLAAALGVSPCDLLKGITWKPEATASGRFEFPDSGASL
jgi:transcriptional regulator with XRE-family HTH domain